MKKLISILLIFNFQLLISNCQAQSPVDSVASGCALDFNGVNNYVSVPNNAVLNFGTSDFSISFWYYPNSLSNQALISKRQFCNGSYMWDIRGNASAVSIEISEQYPSSYSAISVSPLNLNKWFHITFTRKQDSLFSYLNGILIQKVRSSGGLIANVGNNANLNFSQDPCIGLDGTTFLNAQIDEVRIWNRALTQTEIQQDMCKKLTGTETGLVGYWRFDDCGGVIATDASGNGNNGTLN